MGIRIRCPSPLEKALMDSTLGEYDSPTTATREVSRAFEEGEMTKDEALKLALETLEYAGPSWIDARQPAITAIKEALAQPEQGYHAVNAVHKGQQCYVKTKPKEPEQEPVAWKYDVTYNQDGTVSVALPDGDELRIVLPNQQEPYCWTWDVWVSGGKWRAEYGWKKPTEKVVNLQPLYTSPPQRKPLTDEEVNKLVDDEDWYNDPHGFVRAIEAAHGIKGEA